MFWDLLRGVSEGRKYKIKMKFEIIYEYKLYDGLDMNVLVMFRCKDLVFFVFSVL